MWLQFSALLVAAYLLGSVPIAYIIVKIYRGVDVRNYGSGGVGGSNVFRNFSKPLGILVGVFDAGKGALMVWIAMLVGLSLPFQMIIGVAVVIGHNWSVFMGFNSGRGIATSLGVFVILWPWNILIILADILVIVIIGSSPVPVLVGMAAIPLVAWFFHQPLALVLGFAALFFLMLIRRLTPPRSDRSTPVSNSQLLFNRLLFDRDIRDGKEWSNFRRLSHAKK